MKTNRYQVNRFGVDGGYREYNIKVGIYNAISEEDAINQHAEKAYGKNNREFMKGYLSARILVA